MTGHKRMGQEATEQQDAIEVKKSRIEKKQDEQKSQQEKPVLRRGRSGAMIGLRKLPERIWDVENKPPGNAVDNKNHTLIPTRSILSQSEETDSDTDSSSSETLPKLEVIDPIGVSVQLIIKFKQIILAAYDDAKFAAWIQMKNQQTFFAQVKLWDQMLRGVLISPKILKEFIQTVREVNTNVNAMFEFFDNNPNTVNLIMAIDAVELQKLTDAWLKYNRKCNKIAEQNLSAQDHSLSSAMPVVVYQNPIFGKAVSASLDRKSKYRSKQDSPTQKQKKTTEPTSPQI